MGQVAGGGQDAVVARGVHLRHLGAHRLPQRAHARERLRAGLRHRGEDHAAAAEERGEGRLHAAALGAGHRVARHEAREGVPERGARVLHHRPLGAAHVRDDRLRAEARGERLHQRPHRPQGHGEHHEVRPGHALGGLGRPAVHHPERARALEALAAPADADDLAREAGLAGGERERAADEADARHRQSSEARRRHRPSTRASASRKRRFSSGRPTVTRRCRGRP